MPQPADCPARDVTDEELEAFKWKCSLQHMPAPLIKDIALKLESPVLASIVEAFRGRSPAVRKKEPKRFIIKRDCKVDQKKGAVEDLFSWLEEKYGEGTCRDIRKNQGRLPYGSFTAYVRDHEQLMRKC